MTQQDVVPYHMQVSWVRHLPKEGGDWGQGVVGTVVSVEAEVARLQSQRATHLAEVERIDANIKDRTALLKAQGTASTNQATLIKTRKEAIETIETLRSVIASTKEDLDGLRQNVTVIPQMTGLQGDWIGVRMQVELIDAMGQLDETSTTLITTTKKLTKAMLFVALVALFVTIAPGDFWDVILRYLS